MTSSPRASSSGLGWVPAWLCPGASTLGIPARKVLGSLPGLGQGRGAGGRAGPPRVRSKGRGPEPGCPILCPRPLPAGARARARSGAWRAITGGRPGRSARALLAADHRRRAPPAGPGARLLPGTRSQAAPSAPGRGGPPLGPRGRAVACAFPRGGPGPSEGFSRRPAGEKGARGQRAVLRWPGEREASAQRPQDGAVQTHRGHGHSVATEYGFLTRMRGGWAFLVSIFFFFF